MSLSQDINSFLGPKYILVLEPVHNYRSSMKNFFNNLKVKNVRFVGSVGEAKREMLTLKVGLFIVEWLLPEKNGIQFCRELRKDQSYRSTPFLLMSTENHRKDVILASEGGINSYLLKPFSYEDFCSQLSIVMAGTKVSSPLNSLLERAEAHLEQNELWVSEALFKEAMAIKPNSARALCGLGRLELANKNLPSALEYFQKSITTNPDYVDGYKYILQMAEMRGDFHGILQAASILHNISPDNPRYTLMIAFAHLEIGNLEESENFFKSTVRLSPMLADGYKGLGNLYLQKKDYEKARKNLEKALDLDIGDVSTLNSLGLSYVRQNMLQEGIEKYRIALAIDSNDPRVLFNLGLALEMGGDLQGAKEALQRAVKSDPKFEKAKRNIDRIQSLEVKKISA